MRPLNLTTVHLYVSGSIQIKRERRERGKKTAGDEPAARPWSWETGGVPVSAVSGLCLCFSKLSKMRNYTLSSCYTLSLWVMDTLQFWLFVLGYS